MKKTLPFVILLSVLSGSIFSQHFIRVTQADLQRQVRLMQNEALEVRLPCTPSTGFGWYLANNDESILKQVGDWEFSSDHPENPIGSSGTQINHYIPVASGTIELEWLYKRVWENAKEATASYKITITSEGAYTGEEVKPYLPADPSELINENNKSTLALPAAFSWQAQNLCTPVKNQGQCGSCWSFAACASFESVVKIWDNVTRDMSEQWLVNCTPNADCGGGWCPDNMFKSNGCVYEADEKYKAADGTCKSTYVYHEKAVGYKELATNPTTDQIKQAIYNYGPVWACVCAGTNFDAYKSGVLTKSDGTTVNHAIVLCGWDDATSSWVLRNSWGTSWGENSGYMRIKWGVSSVGYKATYIDYKGIIDHTITSVSNLHPSASIQLSPNPGNGALTFSGLESINTIEVYDLVGNLVYQAQSNGATALVDLKDKSQGMYLYKVINTHGTNSGKLMVY